MKRAWEFDRENYHRPAISPPEYQERMEAYAHYYANEVALQTERILLAKKTIESIQNESGMYSSDNPQKHG